MNFLFNSKNKAKSFQYLKNKSFPSKVLITEEWLGRFPKKRFIRRIGQQITRWSCVPTGMEIVNALMHGDSGTRQEVLKKYPRHTWQQLSGETRYFMPFDKKTALMVMKDMGIQFEKAFTKEEMKPEKILIPQPYPKYG